jgi:hypothetical protein
MSLLWRSSRCAAATGVESVDFAFLKPPQRLRIPIPKLLEHLRLIGCFDELDGLLPGREPDEVVVALTRILVQQGVAVIGRSTGTRRRRGRRGEATANRSTANAAARFRRRTSWIFFYLTPR